MRVKAESMKVPQIAEVKQEGILVMRICSNLRACDASVDRDIAEEGVVFFPDFLLNDELDLKIMRAAVTLANESSLCPDRTSYAKTVT